MFFVSFFDRFFQSIGGLFNFVTGKYIPVAPAYFKDGGITWGTAITNISILDALSISLVGILLMCLALHLWHLFKLIF